MSDGIKMDLRMPVQNTLYSKHTLQNLNGGLGKKEADIEKVAHEFESYLMFTMLKELEKTVQSSKKSHTEQTYMSLVYEKVGDFMAKKGIGIKEMLVENMEKKAKVLEKKSDNTVK